MTDYPHAKDFNGNALQVGDTVVYITQNRSFAHGIIMDISATLGYHFYQVLDRTYPNENLNTVSRNEIMYTGNDYRGMTKDYLLSLHGVKKD